MEPFYWKQSYDTGIKQIDRDHRAIFELANELYSSVHAGNNKADVLQTCEKIVNFTEEHFSREEKYMMASDFPETEEHKFEHARLIENARQLLLRLKTDLPGGSIAIYHVLLSIFIEHIPEFDKPFGDYFLSKIKE